MIRCEFDESRFDDWLSGRPGVIQDLGRRFRPNRLYKMASTGHRVYPLSYSEDGTLTVAVTGEYNLLAFGREVFGIKPEDLEECDLPESGEPLGVALEEREDVELFIRAERKRAACVRT